MQIFPKGGFWCSGFPGVWKQDRSVAMLAWRVHQQHRAGGAGGGGGVLQVSQVHRHLCVLDLSGAITRLQAVLSLRLHQALTIGRLPWPPAQL